MTGVPFGLAKSWRARLLVGAGVTVAMAMSSCGSNAGGGASPSSTGPSLSLITPGTLTVATYGSAAPAMTITGNTLGGLDGALINAFVAAHHLKLDLYQTTFASVILAVEQGKADLGTYYYYTAARASQVYYTFPFFLERAAMFTQKSFNYSGPASMQGKKVGTVVGFVWAPYLQTVFGSNAVLYPNSTDAAEALINGQIQGYVNSSDNEGNPPINNNANIVPNLIQPGQYGMPTSALNTLAYNFVNCGNKGLAQALNAEMTTLHQGSAWDNVLTSNGLPLNVDSPLQAPAQECP